MDSMLTPPIARNLMSSPVRTVCPETTIATAQRLLLRYGHSGLCVVDAEDRLVGIISRRDLEIALRHGFGDAPVKDHMATELKTVTPEAKLPDIEALMMTYGIGRLPVLANDRLIGIVTRTDVLRQIHRSRAIPEGMSHLLHDRLTPALWKLLQTIADQAERLGWQLYLVGGAVRDLLLADLQPLQLQDIDLVVDGFHQAIDSAGVELAQALQQIYPQVRLQIHGQFQTAALLWQDDPALGSLGIDIATARTEFYLYPAANPEVEASSITQDLYRRDFTINALAVRLTAPGSGELLDFFGGGLDLKARQIRVIHANSFIEDPTRIFRAVRFAVRLKFQLEPQTERYIRYAIASGIYQRIQADAQIDKAPALQTRLRQELKYILQTVYWQRAMRWLSDLGALVCIHPQLRFSNTLWQQMRRADRWLKRFNPQNALHWQVLLEVLLSALSLPDRLTATQTLQLPIESGDRLQNLPHLQDQIFPALSQCDRPSQVVKLLRDCDRTTLILLGATAPRSARRPIWQYLAQWQTVQAPLNGNDLKTMGYKPGKQYKEILERVLAATLDGEVGDRDSAENLVKTQFPLRNDRSTGQTDPKLTKLQP
ncbi:MAG: CBS domain-containing protein [Drouetiella hepatica Uher 2000/2452]|jgi:tRNA nucleotidyltransferase (CCA-adding enzyme)|uniref:CBS domain-containing protein n=1 Tax=Drouetiella hepatica Uher 2000/2452 TaxID=904376 RepID=A0A951Q716_9CYAN|nr:CBS domain-containing protein [Drouetiella hepatica Uher 2000/2452]